MDVRNRMATVEQQGVAQRSATERVYIRRPVSDCLGFTKQYQYQVRTEKN